MKQIMNELNTIVKAMETDFRLKTDITGGMLLGAKYVDPKSLEIAGVDTKDYPDFCDAYFETGYFCDGTEMNDEQLEEFQDENPELVSEMAFESLY